MVPQQHVTMASVLPEMVLTYARSSEVPVEAQRQQQKPLRPSPAQDLAIWTLRWTVCGSQQQQTWCMLKVRYYVFWKQTTFKYLSF